MWTLSSVSLLLVSNFYFTVSRPTGPSKAHLNFDLNEPASPELDLIHGLHLSSQPSQHASTPPRPSSPSPSAGSSGSSRTENQGANLYFHLFQALRARPASSSDSAESHTPHPTFRPTKKPRRIRASGNSIDPIQFPPPHSKNRAQSGGALDPTYQYKVDGVPFPLPHLQAGPSHRGTKSNVHMYSVPPPASHPHEPLLSAFMDQTRKAKLQNSPRPSQRFLTRTRFHPLTPKYDPNRPPQGGVLQSDFKGKRKADEMNDTNFPNGIWLPDFKNDPIRQYKNGNFHSRQRDNFRSRAGATRDRVNKMIKEHHGDLGPRHLQNAMTHVLQEGINQDLYHHTADDFKEHMKRNPHLLEKPYHVGDNDDRWMDIIKGWNPN